MSNFDFEAYAKEHIAYEIRTLIASSRIRPTRDPQDQDFVTNALYVAFCTHARQISDFLRNGGPTGTIRINNYIPKSKTQKGKPNWVKNVDNKIVHLGKERVPNYSVDVGAILQDIKKDLWEFYDALPPEKRNWFAVIPECFPKQSDQK